MKMRFFMALLISLGSCLPAQAADTAPLTRACFSGDEAARESQARGVLASVIQDLGGNQNYQGSESLDEMFGVKKARFFHSLGHILVDHQSCVFGPQVNDAADFATIGSVVNSIADKTIQRPYCLNCPSWLKPGFSAILESPDSDSRIFVEFTIDGAVFHSCEPPADGSSAVPQLPSEKCPRMQNSNLYIPVDYLMRSVNGLRTASLVTLRALADVSVVVTSNMGFAYISPIAQATVAITQPDPISVIERDADVRTALRDLFQQANYTMDTGRDPSATLLVGKMDDSYANVKAAFQKIILTFGRKAAEGKFCQAKNPNDPNYQACPGEVWGHRSFLNDNILYCQAHKDDANPPARCVKILADAAAAAKPK